MTVEPFPKWGRLEEYERLKARLLSRLVDRPFLPDFYMLEKDEQRIAAAVCRATGMALERWDRLSLPERVPWLETTIESLSEHESKVESNSIERESERLVLASGDENAAEIMRIGNQKDLSGELKMLAILDIDQRYAGRDSADWGVMLKVSDAAVRQYGLWRALHRGDGDEIKRVMQVLRKRLNKWTNRG